MLKIFDGIFENSNRNCCEFYLPTLTLVNKNRDAMVEHHLIPRQTLAESKASKTPDLQSGPMPLNRIRHSNLPKSSYKTEIFEQHKSLIFPITGGSFADEPKH
ncbi:hypothetical protein H8E77_12295 [bacterium]|nr:hypothetical protein [bacterium]